MGLNYIEMFVIEKYPKITGKCSILMYLKTETSVFPIHKLRKFSQQKILNLSIIKEYIQNQSYELEYHSENEVFLKIFINILIFQGNTTKSSFPKPNTSSKNK